MAPGTLDAVSKVLSVLLAASSKQAASATAETASSSAASTTTVEAVRGGASRSSYQQTRSDQAADAGRWGKESFLKVIDRQSPSASHSDVSVVSTGYSRQRPRESMSRQQPPHSTSTYQPRATAEPPGVELKKSLLKVVDHRSLPADRSDVYSSSYKWQPPPARLQDIPESAYQSRLTSDLSAEAGMSKESFLEVIDRHNQPGNSPLGRPAAESMSRYQRGPPSSVDYRSADRDSGPRDSACVDIGSRYGGRQSGRDYRSVDDSGRCYDRVFRGGAGFWDEMSAYCAEYEARVTSRHPDAVGDIGSRQLPTGDLDLRPGRDRDDETTRQDVDGRCYQGGDWRDAVLRRAGAAGDSGERGAATSYEMSSGGRGVRGREVTEKYYTSSSARR